MGGLPVTNGVTDAVTNRVSNHDNAGNIPLGPCRDSCGEELNVWDLVRPERMSLVRLKRVSVRNRSWFTVLDWRQRRFVDAVITTVDRIRSLLLLRTLAPLVKRLLTALGGSVVKGTLVLMARGAYRMIEGVAEKIVRIAQKWGNNSAHEWVDEKFVRYLMIMYLPENRNS